MLNHQRELTLPRPTAAPTATQLRVVLTPHLLLLQRLAFAAVFALDSAGQPAAVAVAADQQMGPAATENWSVTNTRSWVAVGAAVGRGSVSSR